MSMSRLAVIFGFFSILAYTQQILLQSREHRGPNLIFMSLKHPPPSASIKIVDNTLKFRPKMGQIR